MIRNPVQDLIGHQLRVGEVDRPDHVGHPLTRTFSRIGARSSPAGMVPYAPPHWPPIRVARNLGDGGMPVPHQQQALQREADVLGDLAGPILDGLEVVELGLEPVDVGVEAWVLAGGLGKLVEQHVDAFGQVAIARNVSRR